MGCTEAQVLTEPKSLLSTLLLVKPTPRPGSATSQSSTPAQWHGWALGTATWSPRGTWEPCVHR